MVDALAFFQGYLARCYAVLDDADRLAVSGPNMVANDRLTRLL